MAAKAIYEIRYTSKENIDITSDTHRISRAANTDGFKAAVRWGIKHCADYEHLASVRLVIAETK